MLFKMLTRKHTHTHTQRLHSYFNQQLWSSKKNWRFLFWIHITTVYIDVAGVTLLRTEISFHVKLFMFESTSRMTRQIKISDKKIVKINSITIFTHWSTGWKWWHIARISINCHNSKCYIGIEIIWVIVWIKAMNRLLER